MLRLDVRGLRSLRPLPSANEGVPVPPKAHPSTQHVAERYGLVWMCPGEPAAGIPEIPQDTDSAYRRLNVDVELWRASATRLTDNFVDISHFPFVHTGTFDWRRKRGRRSSSDTSMTASTATATR